GTYTATLTVTDNNGATASDSAVVTVAGGGSSTWSRDVGSTGSDAGYAVRGDAAGDTFVGGPFPGRMNAGGRAITSAGGGDAWVGKYGAAGSVLWARSMGGSGGDAVDGLAVDGNGDVVVSGHFVGTASFGGTALVANGTGDMFVAKYSGTNGAHQWS